MDEATWLASDVAQPMFDFLNHASAESRAVGVYASRVLTDRKLLLLAAASTGVPDCDIMSVRGVHPCDAGISVFFRMTCQGDNGDHSNYGVKSPSAVPWLLREIVGNPWRPITLPPGPRLRCGGCNGTGIMDYYGGVIACECCDGTGRGNFDGTCPWKTPDVVRLATEAYEERGRECEACKGERFPGYFGSSSLADAFAIELEQRRCGTCKGKGRIDDGTLDVSCLAALSDALEEAGCDDAGILAHLRRPASCKACKSTGEGVDEYTGTVVIPGGCPRCRGHVGPHWRGCWALDLILGRS